MNRFNFMTADSVITGFPAINPMASTSSNMSQIVASHLKHNSNSTEKMLENVRDENKNNNKDKSFLCEEAENLLSPILSNKDNNNNEAEKVGNNLLDVPPPMIVGNGRQNKLDLINNDHSPQSVASTHSIFSMNQNNQSDQQQTQMTGQHGDGHGAVHHQRNNHHVRSHDHIQNISLQGICSESLGNPFQSNVPPQPHPQHQAHRMQHDQVLQNASNGNIQIINHQYWENNASTPQKNNVSAFTPSVHHQHHISAANIIRPTLNNNYHAQQNDPVIINPHPFTNNQPYNI